MGVLICMSSLISAALSTEWFSRYSCFAYSLSPFPECSMRYWKPIVNSCDPLLLGLSFCRDHMPILIGRLHLRRAKLFLVLIHPFLVMIWLFDIIILWISRYIVYVLTDISLWMDTITNTNHTINLRCSSLPSNIHVMLMFVVTCLCFESTFTNSI